MLGATARSQAGPATRRSRLDVLQPVRAARTNAAASATFGGMRQWIEPVCQTLKKSQASLERHGRRTPKEACTRIAQPGR